MVEFLKDFSIGSLSHYRQSASFNWKKMKQALYSDEAIRFENEIYQELENYPELLTSYLETLNLNKLRQLTLRKSYILKSIEDKFKAELNASGEKQFVFKGILYSIDASAVMKKLVSFSAFAVEQLGTERHKHFLEKLENCEILGCYALTEISHGSNAKNMRTTATYDANTQQFILNTPDFEAAKCWIGSLGKSSTHMILFANLITIDGIDHGLHPFAVPIRDPATLITYPGLKVFDMGEKIGLNGIDNGAIMFNNYAIPRKNLFNKIADVTEDGKYVTHIQNPNKRFALMLSALLDGRLFITTAATMLLTKAIAIAVRYGAVRRQFSAEEGGEEIPILEYQSHQCRLLPHLASAYAFNIFCSNMFSIFSNRNKVEGDLAEIHAVLSASKALSTSNARDGIQECREACGGHGYLKAAGIGHLRDENDGMLTAEGDNHVIIQQTSKWLLKCWYLIVIKKEVVATQLNSIEFFNKAENILNSKCKITCVEDAIHPKHIFETFQWLICYLLETCSYTLSQNINDTNSIQIRMENLAVAYLQHFILVTMFKKISLVNDPEIKTVLLKLFSLYGICNLLNHILVLYEGGYATEENMAKFLLTAKLNLCADLKNEAVSLIDAVGPRDRIINSVLGYSDGQVYKRLESAILNTPEATERPSWWKEIVNWKNTVKAKM